MHNVAQAVHWFDYSKLWPEVARTLRSGGTAAFWVSYIWSYEMYYGDLIRIYTADILRVPTGSTSEIE